MNVVSGATHTIRFGFTVLLLGILMLPGVQALFLQQARAAAIPFVPSTSQNYDGMYQASDALGQTDVSGAAHVDTKAQDSALPNAQGLTNNANIAADTTHHKAYVTDKGNCRVLVHNLDVNNQFIDTTADAVIGAPDMYTRHCDVTDATSFQPEGIAVDMTRQYLFIGDTGAQRVLVFDVSAGITTNLAPIHVIGRASLSDITTSLDSDAQTPDVTNLAFDPNHNYLFVSDINDYGRVTVFDVAAITDGENAVYAIGKPDLATSGCTMSTLEELCAPKGITYDATRDLLYVADLGWTQVLVFDLSNGVSSGMSAAYELGQSGGDENFNSPTGIAIDTQRQHLFVVDQYNFRALVFDVAAIVDNESPVNVIGQPDFTAHSLPSEPDEYTLRYSEAGTYFGGHFYEAETTSNRILGFPVTTLSDRPQATVVLGQPDFTTQLYNYTVTPNSLGFYSLNGSTALDTVNHRLFVSDPGYNRIQVFNLDAQNNLLDHEADYVLGQPDMHRNTLNNPEQPNATTLTGPLGLAFDNDAQRLFVADTSNSRIAIFDLAGGISNGMAISHVLGQQDFTSNLYMSDADSNGIADSNTLNNPTSLAFDAVHDRLYVGDTGAARIIVYNLGSGITDGADADYVIGQPGFDPPASEVYTEVGSISGLVYDEVHERLFVSDADVNNRVLSFDVSTLANGPVAEHVLCQPDLDTVGNRNVSQTECSSPTGLGFDAARQQLFVADTGNHRLLVFDVATMSDGAAAVSVIGQPDYITGESGSSRTKLSSPSSQTLTFDTAHRRLYVPDTNNYRLVVYDLAQLVENVPGATIDQSYSPTAVCVSCQGEPVFSVMSGSLPVGLTLNPSSGVLSGTPSSAGTFAFTIGVDDVVGTAATISDTQSYSMVVAGATTGGSADTTPPVITRRGISPVTVYVGMAYFDEGATASDDTDGDISSRIAVSSTVDMQKAGTYLVSYNVSDMAGNLALTVSRTVQVIAEPTSGAVGVFGPYGKGNAQATTATESTDITSIIRLSEDAHFTSGDTKNTSLKVGDTVTFVVGETQYSLRVTAVEDNVVTFELTPGGRLIAAQLGKATTVSVGNGGIELTVGVIQNGTAEVSFRALRQTEGTHKTEKPKAPSAASFSDTYGLTVTLLAIALLAIILGFRFWHPVKK